MDKETGYTDQKKESEPWSQARVKTDDKKKTALYSRLKWRIWRVCRRKHCLCRLDITD